MTQSNHFSFQQFDIQASAETFRVGTDAVLLGALLNAENTHQALEVGCGTGVISLMLAQRYPQLKIEAIDISQSPVMDARQNFSGSKWANRLTSKLCAMQEYSTTGVDLVFTNPPFFETGPRSAQQTMANARHTDALSYQELVEKAYQITHSKGRLAVIIPESNRQNFVLKCLATGFHLTRDVSISSFENEVPVRRVLEFSKQQALTSWDHLHIYKAKGLYSEAFKSITKSFYLDGAL